MHPLGFDAIRSFGSLRRPADVIFERRSVFLQFKHSDHSRFKIKSAECPDIHCLLCY